MCPFPKFKKYGHHTVDQYLEKLCYVSHETHHSFFTRLQWFWMNFQRIWMDLDGFGWIWINCQGIWIIFSWILIKEDTIKKPLYLEPPVFRTPDTHMEIGYGCVQS